MFGYKVPAPDEAMLISVAGHGKVCSGRLGGNTQAEAGSPWSPQ
jgi:hypothetical protein